VRRNCEENQEERPKYNFQSYKVSAAGKSPLSMQQFNVRFKMELEVSFGRNLI
jgi:hypothetical protein